MKSLSFLVIIFVLCQKATANIPPNRLCPKPNDEFALCGTACPLTCDNHLNPPKVCSKECVRGCVCKAGFVKNRAGDCVLPRDCPKVPLCPAHEEYSRCGTSCPLTCENHLNPPRVCLTPCVKGCVCKAGFVRNRANDCVLPRECHKRRG